MQDLLRTTVTIRTLLICLFILLAGLSSGVFFGGIIPVSEKLHLASMIQISTLKLLPLLLTNTAVILFIILAGFTVYGFPLALIALWFRSFSVGLCDCLLLYNQDSGSTWSFIVSFLLPQLFLCGIYLLITAASTGYALRQLHPRR